MSQIDWPQQGSLKAFKASLLQIAHFNLSGTVSRSRELIVMLECARMSQTQTYLTVSLNCEAMSEEAIVAEIVERWKNDRAWTVFTCRLKSIGTRQQRCLQCLVGNYP